MRWTSRRVEIAVAQHFGYRRNIIVPNVWWGLNLAHECDLLMLRPSGYAEEIEIKISKADLKADAKKWHQHRSAIIHKLWFAVPVALAAAATEYAPGPAGILEVGTDRRGVDVVRVIRVAARIPARKLTAAEREKLLQLAHMRVWTLKECLQRVSAETEMAAMGET